MTMQVQFTAELRGWILHNLDRGCAEEDLVNAMLGQKFEPVVARGLVNAFMRARRDGMEPPLGSVDIDSEPLPYHYEPTRLAAGNVIRAADRDIAVAMRLERPCVVVLESVLSSDECDRLIALARPRMQPSTVVDTVTGENKMVAHRDSEGMFFRLQETAFIGQIDQRVSALMNRPVDHGEGLQVLRYGAQAKTSAHFDFLQPTNAANRESIARSGQRVSTLVIYLNNVAQGGETVFPELGLSVAPRKGNAVYFEYANSRQQLDFHSVHAGAAVLAGEKWAATKWMRERRFVPAGLES